MAEEVHPPKIFRFGQFEADVNRGSLTRNGLRIKIQDQPFRVLVLLLQRPGDIVTREELRQNLWSEGTYVDFDGSLNVILKKLRAALDDDSDNPRFVETIPRRGYRFIAPVTVPEPPRIATPELPSVPTAFAAASAPAPQPAPATTPGVPRRPYLIYALAAAALVVAITAISLIYRGRTRHTAQTATNSAPAAVRKSVAVLGFHNTSGRAVDNWLTPALAEMLSTELAGGERLRLVSGEQVANLRLSSPWSQTDTLDQETTSRIGSSLNSDFLVLGSYTILGKTDHDQIRLDVRLQDAQTGEILTEIAEISDAQDLFQIVSRVGAKLRDRMGVPRLEESEEVSVLAALPRDREAAKFYSLGIARLRKFDATAARDLLQQAIVADPKFPLSHSMLARAWSDLGYEQKRKDEAKKAFDLSSSLPRADRMLVEGDYYEATANHEKAASVYRALFELFPDSVEYGLQLASAQSAAGHGSEARETLRKLRSIPSPSSDDPRIDLGEAKIAVSKVESLALIRKALAKSSAQADKLVYARARRDECITLVYGDHPEQGPASCEEAYNIFLAAGNRLIAADCLRLIADRLGAEGHFEGAISMYQRSLSVLEGMDEHEKTGAILNNMATDYLNEGKIGRGEQLYREAQAQFEKAGDKYNAVVVLSNVADIHYLRGDLSGAAKLYDQALTMETQLDPSLPGYLLYRLADLDLTQGNLQSAHRRLDAAMAAIRSEEGNFQDLAAAEVVLGELLQAEGNFDAARHQFQQSLETRQKNGANDGVQESNVELAQLSLEEGHPESAESLLRNAITEFEKENSDPAATNAYTLLSRALLMQGKLDDANNALQRANKLAAATSDPSLKISAAIQTARVALANGERQGTTASLSSIRQALRSAMITAQKLDYYGLECEARVVLGQLDLKTNPTLGKADLTSLASQARDRGLELLARHAEQAIASGGNVIAVNRTAR